jgi:ribonuclease D
MKFSPVDYQQVTTQEQLASLCRQIASARKVGFDTEFVSEDTFRPQLCLVQVIVEEGMAVVDPLQVPDLSPLWTALANGDHVSICHAAREELNFCLSAIDRPPANLFDTQLAAAFCSNEYPGAYSTVVSRILGKTPAKGEQRTDWRRRPLSAEQIQYALEDVRYLIPLQEELSARIERLGRSNWLAEEMASFVEEVATARSRQRWRKVSGIGNLAPRNLAIVRELWIWRQEEAERRDIPPRRVLRDDLIVELAKRKSSDVSKIRDLRGMTYRSLKHVLDDIAACIDRGLSVPLDELKPPRVGAMPSQLNLLGQVLVPAITSVCRRHQIAASLACTATDIREMIAFQIGFGQRGDDDLPALASGWRAELIGSLIDDLLSGRKAIRIDDPRSEHPLDLVDSSDEPTDGQLRDPES